MQESVKVIGPNAEVVYIFNEMGCHRSVNLIVFFGKSLHVAGGRLSTDITLVEVIINNRDIDDVIDTPIFLSLSAKKRLWKKVVIIFAVGLLKPIVANVYV